MGMKENRDFYNPNWWHSNVIRFEQYYLCRDGFNGLFTTEMSLCMEKH